MIVSPEEIGDIYGIVTCCIYQGYEFPIIREENNGLYVLESGCTITMPLKLLNQLGFSQVDKGVFEKKIKKEEADLVYEKKTLITDFLSDTDACLKIFRQAFPACPNPAFHNINIPLSDKYTLQNALPCPIIHTECPKLFCRKTANSLSAA